jgi:pimeloyl-ACP methyl ester carboxylesterase
MKYFAYDGMRIAYVARGAGEPVVMLHNGGAAHIIWTKQIEALSATRRVDALDLLGFGESGRPADPDFTQYTLDRHVDVLAAFLAHEQLTQVALVGNCMGSAISLTYARRHPETVSAIVACNPLTGATATNGGASAMARFAQRTPAPVARILGKLTYPRSLVRAAAQHHYAQTAAYRRDETLFAGLRSCPWRSLMSIGRDINSYVALDEWDRTGPHEVPVCTLWGVDNPILSAEAGRKLNKTLHPVREEWLQPGSHFVMLERADEVNAVIDQFLDQHQPSTAVSQRGN